MGRGNCYRMLYPKPIHYTTTSRKTPYELLHDRKPDLSYLHVFGALCYPNNDSENLGKLQAKADIDLGLHSMTPATSSSGLVPNPIHQQPCILPPRDDWDCLFQPMFDEYFNPLTIAVSPVPVAAAPRDVDTTESPVSMLIDLDAPSTNSTSQGLSSNVRPTHTIFEHLGRWTKDHLIANVIGDPSCSVSMRKQLEIDAMWCYFNAFLTSVEPKNFKQAMTKPSWIDAMQEEIHEFERLQDNPSHVYKLKKALYGLKQAPRAWYDMLSSFLISQHFSKGAVDPTLFTWKARNNLLLVKIYVDDIIFASTTTLCNEFANLMTTKFKMSMMGHMSFFLGLQISQSPRRIFLNQSKYASKIIKKYGLLTSDSVDTPMVKKNKLDEDLQGTPVDATLYRGMIVSLMYLTSSRPDLIYAVCLCAQDQAKPTEKHLNADSSVLRQQKWIVLCCNNVHHSRAKHIDVRYHFIKEQVENGIVELYFVQTEYQLADIFTKPLPRERFNFLIEKLGTYMCEQRWRRVERDAVGFDGIENDCVCGLRDVAITCTSGMLRGEQLPSDLAEINSFTSIGLLHRRACHVSTAEEKKDFI
ncbi:retrovirus-related pol polyprotein from transposon TNT 1-94 [Tanacetum coccineum]